MDKDTLEALKGSIKKWEGIVKGTVSEQGADNCPLCKMFEECEECPVQEHTGQDHCDDTPYYNAHTATNQNRYAVTEEAKRLAQLEVDFLESLLPEGHTDG